MGLLKWLGRFVLHAIIGAVVGVLFAIFYVMRIWIPANMENIGLSVIIVLPVVVIVFIILGIVFGGIIGLVFRLVLMVVKWIIGLFKKEE